jgi:hypothetical protein
VKSRDYGVVARKALAWNLPFKHPVVLGQGRFICRFVIVAIVAFESNR